MQVTQDIETPWSCTCYFVFMSVSLPDSKNCILLFMFQNFIHNKNRDERQKLAPKVPVRHVVKRKLSVYHAFSADVLTNPGMAQTVYMVLYAIMDAKVLFNCMFVRNHVVLWFYLCVCLLSVIQYCIKVAMCMCYCCQVMS